MGKSVRRSDMARAIFAEYERIGLRPEDSPSLAIGAGAEHDFLARLRSLPTGATWRDVFPEMPAHWVPGRPETFTGPYRPLGPYDYQELPTGPAVHVVWPTAIEASRLERLVMDARETGWPLYGGGLLESTNPEWRARHAILVLERGMSEDALLEFVAWLEQQSDITVAAVPRTGREEYVR